MRPKKKMKMTIYQGKMNFREGIYKIKQKDMNHHKLKKKKVHLKKVQNIVRMNGACADERLTD